MADRTKAELQAENDELRAELAQARQGVIARPSPQPPSFGMTEGMRQDIKQAQVRIAADPKLTKVTLTDPFTGQPVVVTEAGYTVGGNETEDPTPHADVVDPAVNSDPA